VPEDEYFEEESARKKPKAHPRQDLKLEDDSSEQFGDIIRGRLKSGISSSKTNREFENYYKNPLKNLQE
jgi:hypothetical protein